MKKFLSTVLIVSLLFSSVPASLFADDSDENGTQFNVTSESHEDFICGCFASNSTQFNATSESHENKIRFNVTKIFEEFEKLPPEVLHVTTVAGLVCLSTPVLALLTIWSCCCCCVGSCFGKCFRCCCCCYRW
jgi:hypothetical protein